MRRFVFLMVIVVMLVSVCGGVIVVQAAGEAPAATPSSHPQPTKTPTPSTPTPVDLSAEQIAERLRPATVFVTADTGSGTGIVYDAKNGYIVTNAHVVEGASSVAVAVANNPRTRPARLVGIAFCDDLAVLQVENTAGLVAAPLGESATIQPGANVVALGYPLAGAGDDISVKAGTISSMDLQVDEYQNLIVHEAPLNPGNSGGPLVNRDGEVIGINSFVVGVEDQKLPSINYAIATSYAKPIIRQLQGSQNRHDLGLAFDRENNDPELTVTAVRNGSPAERSGVQQFDSLLKINDRAVTNRADLCRVLRSHKDGDVLKLTVRRSTTDKVLTVNVPMGNVKLAPAPSASPTAPSASPAVSPLPAAPKAQKPLVDTNFENNAVGPWPTFAQADWSAKVADGEYTINLVDSNLRRLTYPAGATNLGDGVISADVKLEGRGMAGVMARYGKSGQSNDLYTCWINSRSQFGCTQIVNGVWTYPVPPQTSTAVKPGNNQLVLSVIGTQVVFKLNGQEVSRFSDNSLARGAWGVYTLSSYGNFTAHYDHVTISQAR
jgi:S1-C subfamily serine protease